MRAALVEELLRRANLAETRENDYAAELKGRGVAVPWSAVLCEQAHGSAAAFRTAAELAQNAGAALAGAIAAELVRETTLGPVGAQSVATAIVGRL